MWIIFFKSYCFIIYLQPRAARDAASLIIKKERKKKEASITLIATIINNDGFAQSFHVLMLPACCVATGGPFTAVSCLAFLFPHIFFLAIAFKDLMAFFF